MKSNRLWRWVAAASAFWTTLLAAVAEAQNIMDTARDHPESGVGGAILGALICGWIASSKKRNPWGFAILGFLCCPVGIIVALLAAPGQPSK